MFCLFYAFVYIRIWMLTSVPLVCCMSPQTEVLKGKNNNILFVLMRDMQLVSKFSLGLITTTVEDIGPVFTLAN